MVFLSKIVVNENLYQDYFFFRVLTHISTLDNVETRIHQRKGILSV